MISAYRAGLSAGNAAFQSDPSCQNIMWLARKTLLSRQEQGIAHCVPEQDFLRGFVEGYQQQTCVLDGLCLAFLQKEHKRRYEL